MARGRQTKALAADEIELLLNYQLAGGYSVLGLAKALRAPFTSTTLKKALCGLPVYYFYASWLARWIAARLKGKRLDPFADAPQTENPTARPIRRHH